MLTSFFRFFTILFTLLRYGIDGEINPSYLPWYLRFFCYLLPGRYFFKRATRGKRIRQALESLGPVFIKFGQLLSTRPDLIPEDIFKEIGALQDNTKPFDSKLVVKILEDTFQQSPHDVFSEFSEQAIASASIAQVHKATLHNGKKVAVKIVRPNIEKTIKRDLNGLDFLARIFASVHPDGQRIHPVEIVDDYRHTIFNELDLLHEAANTALLRDNFENSNDLYVPEVFWDYCHKNVLCLEFVSGIPIGDIDALKAAGVDFKQLSERAVRIFFTQFLVDNFFHADMHPGNIFIDVSNPKDASFIAIDCAIMGSLEQKDTIVLAQLLHNIFQRNYMQAAEIFVRHGWVDANTSIPELAGAIRTCNEPVFAKPMDEVSFSQQLMMLFFTGRRFSMQVQPPFVLLQKTLFNIEGLGKQLYPKLDLWDTAKPFLDDWIKTHYSPLNLIKRNAQYLPELLDNAPKIIQAFIADKTNKSASPKTKTSSTSSKVKRLLALLGIGAISIGSAYQPGIITQAPRFIWLLSGALLSWLWLSR